MLIKEAGINIYEILIVRDSARVVRDIKMGMFMRATEMYMMVSGRMTK